MLNNDITLKNALFDGKLLARHNYLPNAMAIEYLFLLCYYSPIHFHDDGKKKTKTHRV